MSAWPLLSSRALLSPMILASASRTFVMLLMGAGGASSAIVPVAAKDSASRGDESSLLALVTPGLGSIPEDVGSAFPGVMRVCGQA